METIKFCANCGHGLTDGSMFCPFCGFPVQETEDLVSQGARYENYEDNDNNIEDRAQWEGNVPSGDPSDTSHTPVASTSMTCFKCGATIPDNSKFCPVCQVKLFVDCPKCGHRYSAQYRNCNQCGTNREEFIKQQEDQAEAEREKRREEERKRAIRQQEEERKTQQGPNWLLIVFFGLFIAWLVSSSSEWFPILFGK